MAEKQHSLWQHLPAIILGVVVAVIFIIVMMSFAVNETEHAILMRFGKPVTEDGTGTAKVYAPGWHGKWPYPIDVVWKQDKRLQCYELKKGQVEQMQTADGYQVLLTTYALWRVGNPDLFLRAVKTSMEAENKLDDVVRNGRNNVLGRHQLTELINVDASKVKMSEIEAEILKELQDVAMQKYGIEVTFVGFKHIGFPEDVTNKVFERMTAERNREAEKLKAEGKSRAQMIKAQADLQASDILAKAEAEAKSIRAEGDRQAASDYAVFAQNPELAAFLRKLESLRLTINDKTTLVLSTQTPPYDLLLPNATDLQKKSPAPAGR